MSFDRLELDASELDYLQEWVHETRLQQDSRREQELPRLRLRLDSIHMRLNRLTDALIDGLLEKPLFDDRKNAVLLEEREVKDQILDWEQNGGRGLARLEKFLELAQSASLLYKTADPSEKRDLIRELTSNLRVSGKNEHEIAGLEMVPERARGLGRRVEGIDVRALHTGNARGFRDELGARADGHEHIHVFCREASDAFVRFRRILPDLEHIAQDRDAALCRKVAQGIERGVHRERTRVVRIIDDQTIFHSGDELHPPVRRFIRSKRFRNLNEVHAENQTHGSGGGRGIGLRSSEDALQPNRHGVACVLESERDPDRIALFHAICEPRDRDGRAFLEAVGDDLRPRARLKAHHGFVVIIEDRKTTHGQAFNEPALFARDLFGAIVELDVHRQVPHRRDDAYVRPRNV